VPHFYRSACRFFAAAASKEKNKTRVVQNVNISARLSKNGKTRMFGKNIIKKVRLYIDFAFFHWYNSPSSQDV